MPIYEYRCSSCGFEKEYLQKLTDSLITDCESCGQPTMRKLMSAAGFQLKGTGWYATDFKGSGTAPKKSDEPKAGSSPGESSSAPECGAGACPACAPAK